jgi:hypothetical protein
MPGLPALIIDLFVLFSAAISATLAGASYRLVKSKVLLLFMLSLIYITGVRIWVLTMVDLGKPFVLSDTELVLGFWLIFPLGMWEFYRILQKYSRGESL